MLSFQKYASDRTGLGYYFSSSNIASSNTTMFVSSTNNVDSKNNDVKTALVSENIDKGKSILRAPPKPKKGNTQKSKQKKQHLCHHCKATGHTRPNCYK